jgi:hypothetical protein
MRPIIALIACGCILGMAGLSGAAQISSPTIFGSGTQTAAECVVVNGGTSNLAVTVEILDKSGVVLRSSNCDGSLAPGQFCSAGGIINAVLAACIATAASVTNLRGALTIEEPAPDGFGGTYPSPVRSAPLR